MASDITVTASILVDVAIIACARVPPFLSGHESNFPASVMTG